MYVFLDKIKRQLSYLGTKSLHWVEPETAHQIGMWLLKKKLMAWMTPKTVSLPSPKRLQTEIPGLAVLDHPVGLGGGFDKNAQGLEELANIGFSFLEAGTLTPQPQPGNPKPRIFRYPREQSLINRMGFPNHGLETVARRIESLPREKLPPLGINLGKNKWTSADHAISDYLKGIDRFQKIADFIVINVSSPNTEGLRQLANPIFLSELAVNTGENIRKVWVKLDPDTPKKQFQQVVETIGSEGFQGIILTNTQRVQWPESGGRSGQPLASFSLSALEWAYEVHRGKLPMIACGGIFSGSDILARIARGACAVQIYTSFVYRGPWVVNDLLVELDEEMKRVGVESIGELKSSYYSDF